MATDPYPLPFRDTESKWSGPNEQPPAASVRCEALILLAARKSYDFSPGVGKKTCLSENVFELFGRPFSLANAIAPPDTSSPRLSLKKHRVLTCPPEAAPLALTAISRLW